MKEVKSLKKNKLEEKDFSKTILDMTGTLEQFNKRLLHSENEA